MIPFIFCFFKQKTAYEMRISDWSSDVCSSDLTTEYAVMAGVVKDQIGGSIFAIFDENARATAVPEPRYAAAHKAGIITLNWVTDKIDEQIAKGKVIKAQTLAELADLVGTESGALETTIARYN